MVYLKGYTEWTFLCREASIKERIWKNLGRAWAPFVVLREYGLEPPQECCGSTVLTAACCWPSSHWIPPHKLVSLLMEFVLSPLLFIFCIIWIDIQSWVKDALLEATDPPFDFMQTIWYCLHFLEEGLQHAFSAACEQVGTKFSIKQT